MTGPSVGAWKSSGLANVRQITLGGTPDVLVPEAFGEGDGLGGIEGLLDLATLEGWSAWDAGPQLDRTRAMTVTVTVARSHAHLARRIMSTSNHMPVLRLVP